MPRSPERRRCRRRRAAARGGTAVAKAASGTISNPKRAIEGIVCSRLRTAKSGPCRRLFRAAATPSGNPIAMAGPTDPATSAMWRSSASAKSCRRVAYSRAIDSPSKVPTAASPAAPAQIAATASTCAAGPAPTRCNASTTASAAHEASTQNAAPSEMRTAGFAPSIRVAAACPAAISTSSSNDAASPASA